MAPAETHLSNESRSRCGPRSAPAGLNISANARPIHTIPGRPLGWVRSMAATRESHDLAGPRPYGEPNANRPTRVSRDSGAPNASPALESAHPHRGPVYYPVGRWLSASGTHETGV